MYLWLKRLFYGCEHEWTFVEQFDTYFAGSLYRKTAIHRCNKCKKIKKDQYL